MVKVELDFAEGGAREAVAVATRGAADAEWVVGRVTVGTAGFRRGMGPVEEVVEGFVAVEGRAEVVLAAGGAALIGPGEKKEEEIGQFRGLKSRKRELDQCGIET